MYNSYDIADRIKKLTKQQGHSMVSLLTSCNLAKNTIQKLSGGTDIQFSSFARIADYLNCSVDYLLGRTEDPALHAAAPALDDDSAELLKVFDGLDRPGRAQLLGRAYELQAAQEQKNNAPRAFGAKDA